MALKHPLGQDSAVKPRLAICGGSLSERQFLQVSEYINEHLDQALKITDLAALLNISQNHFSHLFKQAIGISPYQYLLQQRIERAKQLLKETDLSIPKIALDCGFYNDDHLKKQFRRFTGMTPKAYRSC